MTTALTATTAAARANIAARHIIAGKKTTRAFDNCFEMGDGTLVALMLFKRAETDAALAANIGRYITRPKPITLETTRADVTGALEIAEQKLATEIAVNGDNTAAAGRARGKTWALFMLRGMLAPTLGHTASEIASELRARAKQARRNRKAYGAHEVYWMDYLSTVATTLEQEAAYLDFVAPTPDPVATVATPARAAGPMLELHVIRDGVMKHTSSTPIAEVLATGTIAPADDEGKGPWPTTDEEFDAAVAEYEADKLLLGTPDYRGVAFFWAPEYKHELREATPAERRAVHRALLRKGLPLGGVSPMHAALVEQYAWRACQAVG